MVPPENRPRCHRTIRVREVERGSDDQRFEIVRSISPTEILIKLLRKWNPTFQEPKAESRVFVLFHAELRVYKRCQHSIATRTGTNAHRSILHVSRQARNRNIPQ